LAKKPAKPKTASSVISLVSRLLKTSMKDAMAHVTQSAASINARIRAR